MHTRVKRMHLPKKETTGNWEAGLNSRHIKKVLSIMCREMITSSSFSREICYTDSFMSTPPLVLKYNIAQSVFHIYMGGGKL